MNIRMTKTEGPNRLTILHLEGKMDGSNYTDLIEKAKEQYLAGERHLLIDLSQLTFISSAGLAGIHQVGLLFRGIEESSLDEGWAAYRSIDRYRQQGMDARVKLLAPEGEVRKVLEISGFNTLFEVFKDYDQAINAFFLEQPSYLDA
jgi:anti-anti-sigma regulatory factor